MMEDELTETVINSLMRRGHVRAAPPEGIPIRTMMGGGQAIVIDPGSGTLMGASDPRKDGMALGY